MASLRDRFFVEGVHVLGASVTFAADDARKIATVLRGRTGDRVHVIDSAGSAFAAAIDVVDGVVTATLAEPIERGTRETAVRLTLAQAIPKGQKMDLIVEKATELGVAAVVPLRSERVVGERTGEHKVERWQRLAKTAAQQCGRNVIPAVALVNRRLGRPHRDVRQLRSRLRPVGTRRRAPVARHLRSRCPAHILSPLHHRRPGRLRRKRSRAHHHRRRPSPSRSARASCAPKP